MAERVAIRATIRGRVQGVWYRAWTRENALARNLTGWVRNAPDGSVEALFVGREAQVADMLRACREGPPAARVTAIETDVLPDAPGLSAFEIRR